MRPKPFVATLLVIGIASVGIAGWRGARRSPSPATRPALASVIIHDVPFEVQKPDFCGEACAAMWLHKLGKRGDQDWVFDQSGLDPKAGRGVYASELAQALVRIGFRVGRGWYRVLGGRPDTGEQLAVLFQQMHADLLRGVPSIVCMHYDDKPTTTEHFRLVLGYDATTDQVVYHEPAEPGGAYRRMTREQFIALWPLKEDAIEWTVVRFRLEGDPIQEAPLTDARSGAGYAQHLMVLSERLPRTFSVVLVPPFVVVGDTGEEEVRRHALGSVAWAVKQLKALYFAKDPEEIIDIWLFKDDSSYRHYTKVLFDEEPETPYGYYAARHHALFMNIATGGGTLVHEIVHPYVHANFPAAPPWFNEGLGSLYEQCDEVNGKIVGLVNWRLEGLQRSIRAARLPSFRSLTAADNHEFYKGRHSDTGYGQARYLLLYLQEKGLLVGYYHRFRAARQL
jgi:hypothetical protein